MPNSISEISGRTLSKLAKRANLKCAICGWNKTSLDFHHVITRKNGGSNNNDNLICLCPNCHRLAHENQIDNAILLEKTIDKYFSNWKDFLNIKTGV